ncbi:Integrase catalytic domain-containing protein [Citrus sinensis]|uniref:Integrase catalytic domain-containing protein n=1 Tax=Citrus sinensis TaxID=2711 RepID=A0ACB8JF16_CITSI|nr:Integrase catalytic domain-containing protein [Citrus sinensis]
MAAEIDKKARSTIILSLGDSVIREVANEKTVADLWAKLEKIYMTKSLTNRLYIKRRMFTLKMAEGSSLDDHIDEFNQVCDTLETIYEGLDDEGKALLMVSSLPQSYSNLVDALMYGRSTLSLDEVKAALNTRGLQEKSGNMMHAEGLSVKGKFNKNDGKKKKQKKEKSKAQNKKCFHCNKEGHFKRDCQELKNKSKERNGDAATVEEEGYESAGVCVATEDLQRDGGNVMMGNNAVCKVIGMGNVSLRLHDGTIWELREVRYVPDLKRNLISLGITDVIVGTSRESTRLWHLRLGHMSVKGLKELEKQGVLGKDKIEELDFCEDCVFGKSTRHSFKHSTSKSIGILDYIHSDLWGPVQTSSLGGNSYFLSIIDDYSRRVWVYVLKHKDQVFSKFKEWKTLVENQTGKKVKKLRTDNGLEFCNQQFNSYCANEGIARHKTVRSTPQQNGLAERMNRTLMDKVRCMLVQAKLPKGLWAETLLTASYLVNLSPSAALDFKTPFEIWHGKPASYVNLKVFGCPAYAHCTDLEPPRCIISRDVAFNEKAILEVRKEAGLKTQKPQVQDNIQLEVEHPDSKKSERAESLDQDSEDHDECSDPQPQSQRQTQVQGYQLTKDREKRQIRPPLRYGYADLIAYALAASNDIDVDEPKSYAEAIQSSNKTEWQEAMNEEIASLKKNHTWILVEKAGNRRTVGCKHASIRVLLAMTTVHDLELDQLDVKTAFLHGRLQKEILMTQPEGYVDSEKPNHVCLLKRSLYGLKQSPRQWYLRFDEFMLSHGYLRCSFDCCVYYKQISPNLYIYHLLYVDNMLVACKSREEITVLKNLLSFEFEMKDLGSAKKILGMEIKRDRSKGIIFLSQEKYLRRVLETFGMTLCKHVMTPIATHFKLSSLQCPKTEEEKLEMAKIPYANAAGCMMYAMVLTRPDISYALSVVSRYMVSPGKEHWRAVKWVLRYLSGTLNQGLVYGKSGIKSEGISGFVDSDFAGDLDRRRSLTGSSAIYLSKNPAHHEKTKHIDIKLHFIRNVVSMGVVRMVKIHTDSNPADMLTKVVTTAKFKVCLDIAGLGCY